MKLFFWFLMFCSALHLFEMNAGEGENAWGAEHPGSSIPEPKQGESGFNPGVWLLNIYRDHISPVDGGRCPSMPSCSSYSVEAFKKHGFFLGWIMTVDRLIHEGKEESLVSPLVFSKGTWKLYDPVENNDFWWSPVNRKQNAQTSYLTPD